MRFELTYDHSSSMAGFLVDRHCLVCRGLINHGGLICVVPIGNFSGPVVCLGCIPDFNFSLEDVIRMRQAEVTAYAALSPWALSVSEDSTLQILEALRGSGPHSLARMTWRRLRLSIKTQWSRWYGSWLIMRSHCCSLP